MSIPAAMVGCLYLVMSLVSFVLYGLDKSRARRGGRRVPERTLHLFELLGGLPGALLAQRVFRHKSRKPAYQVVFIGIALLHVVLWAGVIYWRSGEG